VSHPASAPPPYPSSAYAWYVTALLTLIGILSYMDRYILSLLIEPIKQALVLSDFQIGLLIGPAFILLYVVFGLPFGWVADRYNRRIMVSVAVAFWSLMTALCGLADRFWLLFAARASVGLGEATQGPAGVSLIADLFPKETRPKAIAMWLSSSSLGAGSTYLLGGLVLAAIIAAPPVVLPVVGELQAWQTAFMVVGLPGVFVAALVFLTVREPVRRDRAAGTGAVSGVFSVGDAMRYVGERWRPFLAAICASWGSTLIGAGSFWAPSLFLRTWGWDASTSGVVIGTVLLCTGVGFTNLAGWLASYGIRRGVIHAPYLVMWLGILMTMVFLGTFSLMPSPELGVVLFALGMAGMAMTAGTSVTAIVAITPNRLRGQLAALSFLIMNLFGAQIGPPAVGLATDLLGDPALLRYGWTITCVVTGLVANLGLLWGYRHYRTEAQRMAAADS
jgi:MFS family permease